jgi:serine/threonine-protein kinase
MHCEACGQENIDGARFCAKCGALLPVEEHKEDPLIGQVIGGRYRITGVLGEGGMGIVYVAEQQMGSTLRKVAVKTLHPHLSQDPSVLARFHRECGTVAQLEHPNTIKFYDFGATADGTLYIAMEFVKGKSLMDVIEEGPIAPARTLKIMKQVCGALDEAHKLGIIHRDLKPENIILTDRAGETDFVKVLDFGIAARTESSDAQKEQKLTQQGMVLGTPPYMSPEQFTGKELDARSDIYSLGVMSYEMLTGRLPFEADTPWQWATQHMTAQPIPFDAAPSSSSSVPESMRSAIMRALSKEKEQRQTTARQFFEELSGGGGITVDAPAASGPVSLGSAGTAAMPAAPDFAAMGAAAAPAVAAAQPTPGGPPPVAANLPPPPPPARGGGGGGKGLVIGLGGLGLVLLIAIVIVVARGMKPSETDQALANPFSSSSSGATTIAPQVDSAGETATTQATGTAPEDTSTAPQPTHTTTQAHTAAPTHPTATSKPTATAKPPAAGGAQACAACIAAAQGGNISGAAANYSRCNNASAKQRCAAFARAKAPAAARAAAFNGRCPQAKAIAGAARAMGAGSGALNAAVKTCK